MSSVGSVMVVMTRFRASVIDAIECCAVGRGVGWRAKERSVLFGESIIVTLEVNE